MCVSVYWYLDIVWTVSPEMFQSVSFYRVTITFVDWPASIFTLCEIAFNSILFACGMTAICRGRRRQRTQLQLLHTLECAYGTRCQILPNKCRTIWFSLIRRYLSSKIQWQLSMFFFYMYKWKANFSKLSKRWTEIGEAPNVRYVQRMWWIWWTCVVMEYKMYRQTKRHR